jgi:hypothetical protein
MVRASACRRAYHRTKFARNDHQGSYLHSDSNRLIAIEKSPQISSCVIFSWLALLTFSHARLWRHVR